MHFCIGFFGFVRDYPIQEDVDKFLNLLPTNSTVDIFISCPNVLDEYKNINVMVNKEEFYRVFNNKIIDINLYQYDPFKFIKKSREIGVIDFTRHRYHPYRILSLIYTISTISSIIANHIENTNVKYDNIIITRLDIIPTISSFGLLLNKPNDDTLYCWRVISNLNAEDRLQIGCYDAIKILSQMYDNIIISPNDDEFYIELLIGKYIQSHSILKKIQENVNFIGGHKWAYSPYGKYSDEFINYINNIIKLYDLQKF